MTLGQRILTLLRVPHAPSAPAGDHDVVAFRAAPNYFPYRIIRWALSNIGAAFGLVMGLRVLGGMSFGTSIIGRLFWFAEAAAIAGFVAQAAVRLILLRIDIDQRWYLVSDRSLRIREGIINMKEKTMTFANIQNVRIEQGPLQRLFGIADVQVRTAGGGGAAAGGDKDEAHAGDKDLHIGYFRGVSDPEAIRNAILERLRHHADAGLGDPDDRESPQPNELMVAARALLHEAAALRKTGSLIRA